MAFSFSGSQEWYERGAAHSSAGSCSLFFYAKSPNWDHGGGHSWVGGLVAVKAAWAADSNGDFYTIRNRNANTVGATVRTSAGTFNASVSYPTTDEWHRVLAIYDEAEGELQLYIDGATPVATVSTSGTRSSNGGDTALGGFPNNSANTEFKGDLAEIAWWSRALGASEIADLMGATVFPDAIPTDRVHYFPMTDDPPPSPLVSEDDAGFTLSASGSSGPPAFSAHPVLVTGDSRPQAYISDGVFASIG